MCFRSTIQNEECNPPLVRAVILTKWTSASRHRETQRQRVVVVLAERIVENCQLALDRQGRAGRQPERQRLWRENSSAHIHIHTFLTFIVNFGRHETGCMTHAVELLDGAARCKWAYISFPWDKSELLYVIYLVASLTQTTNNCTKTVIEYRNLFKNRFVHKKRERVIC